MRKRIRCIPVLRRHVGPYEVHARRKFGAVKHGVVDPGLVSAINQRGYSAGEYTHTCNVGTFPAAVAGSSFGWTKDAGDSPMDGVTLAWSTNDVSDAELGSSANVAGDIPGTHLIEAVYPNPFNPEATFRFAVNTQQNVRADLVDVSGRVVATLFEGNVAVGETQTVRIDGAGLPSGIYVVRLTGKTFSDALTVTLLK
ncbi:MAG: T9SS type A sorting domain-containing protein [Bacteroidetes bacterium]|nr:T9SS type A sorting domain-containing protein [Bacteroidota bacterium]